VRISVLDSIKFVLSGYKVYPFQTPLMEGEEPSVFDIDEEFYLSNSYFPEISATVSSPMIWRNVRNVNMVLTPIKNNPTSGDLEILSNLTVRIEYYGTSSENVLSPEPRYIHPEYEKMYQSLILNYDYLSLNRKPSRDEDDYKYLIISADNFSPELDEFVNWKMRKGLKTNLVTISETGNTSDESKVYIATNGDGVWIGEDIFGVEDNCSPLVVKNSLLKNYPNPFHLSVDESGLKTTIVYTLKQKNIIELSVYNIKGELVKTLYKGRQNKGKYSLKWDGKNNAGKEVMSGVYIYTLRVGDKVVTKKMLLVR